MKHLFILCATLAISAPALAAPFTYGPDNCEFQITFPEKPFIEKKCTGDGKDCTEIVSYTKAIGASSSTNFRVSCNVISADDVKKYTPDVLEETLKQLSQSNNLTPYNTQSSEYNGYPHASSLSLAERDQKPLIYNNQIWVGKSSLFTLEAEMLGEKNDAIEKTFADILKNTYPKDHPPANKPTSEPTSKPVEKRSAPPASK